MTNATTFSDALDMMHANGWTDEDVKDAVCCCSERDWLAWLTDCPFDFQGNAFGSVQTLCSVKKISGANNGALIHELMHNTANA